MAAVSLEGEGKKKRGGAAGSFLIRNFLSLVCSWFGSGNGAAGAAVGDGGTHSIAKVPRREQRARPRSFVRSFGQRAAATAEPINNFIYTVVRRASGEKGLFLCHSFSAPPIERAAGFKEVI